MNQQQQTTKLRPQIVTKTKNGNTTKQAGRRYRSRMQIIGEILTEVSQVSGGLNKSRLMYKSFLSYAQVRDYISQLLADSLLDYNSTTKKFTVTPKGFRYLENYRVMADLAPNNLDSERIGNYATTTAAATAATAPGVGGY